jgi:hypothetical protein
MFKKAIIFFSLISVLTSIFFVAKYYFSEQNYILTNKFRSLYSLNLDTIIQDLPLLTNDTNNIITYKNDLEEFKNKRKKRAWESLIEN